MKMNGDTYESRCAVSIDLGSNTLRAVRLECASGAYTSVYEKIVRTADGLVHTGRISDEAVERILNALDELLNKLASGSCILEAVTTEALRQASNSSEVLSRIKKESGVDFRIISGEEEIRLSSEAVKNRLDRLGIKTEPMIMVDIGGASTEICYCSAGKEIYRSFDLGIATLVQKAYRSKNIKKPLHDSLKPVREWIETLFGRYERPSSFTATAGTPTTIANFMLGRDYTQYDPDEINGMFLSRIDVYGAMKKFTKMRPDSRELIVGTGRSDLIMAGIEIFLSLFDIFGMDRCVVIDDGLREGVALRICRDRTDQ